MCEFVAFVPKKDNNERTFNLDPAQVIQFQPKTGFDANKVPTTEELDNFIHLMTVHYNSAEYEAMEFRPGLDCDDLF